MHEKYSQICEGGLRVWREASFGHPRWPRAFAPRCTARTRCWASAAPKAKGNDHAEDCCVELRAGGCRDHAQDQARHATRAAAPGSGDYNYAPAQTPGRGGAALTARVREGTEQGAGAKSAAKRRDAVFRKHCDRRRIGGYDGDTQRRG
jgi:hypothetical protein